MANIVAGGLIGSKVTTQFIQPFIRAGFSFTSLSDDCITDSRERLNFSVVGTLPGSYVLGVVWGETDEGTDSDEWENLSNYPGTRWTNPSGQNFTYTAFGLVPATTYYWRATLTIGATSYWSTSQSFFKASCTTTTSTTTAAPTTTSTTTAAPTTTSTTTAAPTTTSTTTAGPTTSSTTSSTSSSSTSSSTSSSSTTPP